MDKTFGFGSNGDTESSGFEINKNESPGRLIFILFNKI